MSQFNPSMIMTAINSNIDLLGSLISTNKGKYITVISIDYDGIVGYDTVSTKTPEECASITGHHLSQYDVDSPYVWIFMYENGIYTTEFRSHI